MNKRATVKWSIHSRSHIRYNCCQLQGLCYISTMKHYISKMERLHNKWYSWKIAENGLFYLYSYCVNLSKSSNEIKLQINLKYKWMIINLVWIGIRSPTLTDIKQLYCRPSGFYSRCRASSILTTLRQLLQRITLNFGDSEPEHLFLWRICCLTMKQGRPWSPIKN